MYCHERNIVHRDIKPDNIMLDANGKIKVIDFGLAIRHNPGTTKDEAGTPRYLAPEVYSNIYDTKADIWALGITMAYLISGWFPYDAKNKEDLKNKVLDKEPDISGTISRDAQALIRSMLIKNPRNRISAKDVLKHKWIVENC